MILVAWIECLECGVTYAGGWEDDSDTIEDIDEAPVKEQVCPACGHVQQELYPGWINRTEAG